MHRNHTPLYRGTANPTVIRAIYQQAVPQHPPPSFPTSRHRSVTVIPRMIAILHANKYMQTLQAHTLINKHTYQPTICAMSLDHTTACCFIADCLSSRPKPHHAFPNAQSEHCGCLHPYADEALLCRRRRMTSAPQRELMWHGRRITKIPAARQRSLSDPSFSPTALLQVLVWLHHEVGDEYAHYELLYHTTNTYSSPLREDLDVVEEGPCSLKFPPTIAYTPNIHTLHREFTQTSTTYTNSRL